MKSLSNQPLVSIVMPVYNGARHLRASINSILTQTYTNFEFIIIDDCSTDHSKQIIESYEDQRIRLVKNQENLKIARSLNKGIKIAQGQYIARMDCDDISLPSRIEEQVAFMEKNKDISVLGTQISYIDEVSEPQGRPFILPLGPNTTKILLSRICTMAHPSVMFRATLKNEPVFYYDPRYLHAEDYELWLRLSSKGFKFSNLDKILLHYRIHPRSITQKNYNIANHTMLRALRVHNPIGINLEEKDTLISLIRKPSNIRDSSTFKKIVKIWSDTYNEAKNNLSLTSHEESELLKHLFVFFFQVSFYYSINTKKIPLKIMFKFLFRNHLSINAGLNILQEAILFSQKKYNYLKIQTSRKLLKQAY